MKFSLNVIVPWMCFLSTSLSCFLVLLAGTTIAADKPNIVLILSDDQGWSDFGFMGHEAVKTPCLDKLARESVVFERGYVPTALCRPSLMTLVTGHYAHAHGVTGNDPSPATYGQKKSDAYVAQQQRLVSFIDKFDTLPELLAEQGYVSFQSGKWWEDSYQRGGFTSGMTKGLSHHPHGRHGDDGLVIGREGIDVINDFVDGAVAADKPFLLWYAPLLPHTPHNPPERLLKKYQDGRPISVAKYYAMCEWFDETCGQVIDKLETAKVRDNTLIIYVTDNGWVQDPNGKRFTPRSKRSPYEGGVRTPILFSWPTKLKPAERTELVSSIDLLPTILAATGARQPTAPKELPGLDLWDNLTSETKINRDAIFGESFAHDIADVEKPEASLLFRWCIEGKWKLLLTYDGEDNRPAGQALLNTDLRPQLFDLSADPWEQTNVAAQHADVVEKLAGRIGSWYEVTERKTIQALP